MGLKYPVVATLLLIQVLAITCSGHTIHYIKPTPDTTCPAEPCLTLSEYAQQPHYYLSSNTTLLLLPGDHVLSVSLRVEGVRSFEIRAQLLLPTNDDPKSTVVCIGLVGLTLRNVSSMTLDGLTFYSCGNGASGYGPLPDYLTAYGMLIILGEDIMIVNCSFEDSAGTALGVFYSNLHLHGNSFTNFCNGHSCMSHGVRTGFSTNTRNGFIKANETKSVECGGRITMEKNFRNFTGNITFRENNSAKYGRGIYAYKSILNFTGNILFGGNSAECGGGIKAKNSILNFTGNTAFRNNSANSGGGIYAYNSTLKFTGNSFFQDNSAEYGGGIRALKSMLHITGNSSFTDNRAENYGGGIYAQSSTLISTGNSKFRDNSARHYGGGIHAKHSTLNFTGNITFRGNSAEYGGGISGDNGILICTGNPNLRDNSARQYGGGIHANHSTLNFTGNSTFRGNSAEYGGGISADYSTVNLTGNNIFINNSAEYGGRTSVYSGALICTGNTNFKDNLAKQYGGGIEVADSAQLNFTGSNVFTSNSAGYGGGISADHSTVNLTGNNIFINNSADYGGGTSVYSGVLICTGNNNFEDNLAKQYGGGIEVADSAQLNFTGSNIFTSNSADLGYGGGISVTNSSLNFAGNNDFMNNSAMQGGGIGAWNSSLTFTGNNTLRDNSAELGGGFGLSDSFVIFIGNSIIRDNSAWQSGGGIKATYSILNFTGNNTFRRNSADLEYGGAISVDINSILRFSGNNAFVDNSAKLFGGGISVVISTLDLTGNTTFTNNSATLGGGVDSLNSNLNFTGSISFKINSAEYGGGVCAFKCTVNFLGNSTFENNSAALSGGGVKAFSSTLGFTGSTTCIHNSAIYGGGIHTEDSSVNIMANSAFRNNEAKHCGGSIYALKTTLNIVGCSVNDKSGKYRDCSSCTLLFMHNSAEILGGAVYTADSTLNFEGCSTFSGNSVKYCGGGVHAQNSTLKFSGNTTFSSNSALYSGGGIHGLGATLYFSGISSFTANTAGRGGGEYLANSFNLFSKNATIDFVNNSATEYGGVVYVEDLNPITYCTETLFALDRCFFETYESFEIPHITPPNFTDDITHAVTAYYNIYIHFYNNHAQIAGSAVYGGAMDICHIRVDYNSTAELGTKFFQMYDVLNIELEPNSVSSDPFQVCPCEDGTPSCDTPELLRQVYPGELLPIPVVAVGQRNGIVPTVIRASFTGKSSLAQFQDTQEVKKNCTELHYQVRSSIVNSSDTLVLYADGPCSTAGNPLNISLRFLPCPPGFSLNSSDNVCGCEPRLHRYTTRCNITRRTLTREGEFWVGYDNDYDLVILHSHCPFDYCKPAKDHISFPLNNTDLQCENNRSGILCGRCKSGHSLALGSSKCLQCTNLHQLLLIPFALAGIALVLLLLICKLTVAAGTINGLIFYANIVTVNRAIFFPPNQTNILTVFISWVNLDLGIETCFFDGMDEYSKTWLQFIFPLYVWSLVVLIIIASEYSSRISRLFGSNPVAVLATLFLLSYGKLLRAVITAMFFTTLDYSDEVKVAVWLCDGNIQYLHGKHTALFLVALLVLLFFLLPYTLLLTVGQWLQANSNRRFFYWINKPRIKPFFDAYQAPFRDPHRYWTGLMLCLRCALFLVFAFNTQADPSINLLAISSVAFGLTLVTRYTGAVYRKLHVDILEASFILNIGILAIATYYLKHAVVPVDQAAVAYTSVGVAFATFIGVVLYHTYQQIWPKLQQRIHHLRDHLDKKCSNSEEERNANSETVTLAAPTTTIIDPPCPESLEIGGSRSRPFFTPYTNFIELREPLELFETDDP